MSTPNPPTTSKKPSLITTAIPPINREPVELDGTPTSPHYGSRISIIGGGGHRLPRADTLDRNSTGTQSATTTTTTTPGSALSESVDRIGAAAIAEADIEGARVGAGVDEAALRMNGQAVGNREGEEDGDQEEDEEVGGVLREQRAALLSSRSRDPAVLVDIPQTPAAEELAAVGAPSDAVDGEAS